MSLAMDKVLKSEWIWMGKGKGVVGNEERREGCGRRRGMDGDSWGKLWGCKRSSRFCGDDVGVFVREIGVVVRIRKGCGWASWVWIAGDG
jgi:hypothetical protein